MIVDYESAIYALEERSSLLLNILNKFVISLILELCIIFWIEYTHMQLKGPKRGLSK